MSSAAHAPAHSFWNSRVYETTYRRRLKMGPRLQISRAYTKLTSNLRKLLILQPSPQNLVVTSPCLIEFTRNWTRENRTLRRRNTRIRLKLTEKKLQPFSFYLCLNFQQRKERRKKFTPSDRQSSTRKKVGQSSENIERKKKCFKFNYSYFFLLVFIKKHKELIWPLKLSLQKMYFCDKSWTTGQW